jgi:dipeptidyl aminopeptidase/acylaminoacyl peptidase
MPNDTHDDIRQLLLGSVSDLPLLAPAPDRTVRRARHRMIRTVSIATLVAGVVLAGILSVANPFSRSMPADHPHVQHGTWVVDIGSGAATRLEGLPRDALWFTASRDGSTVAFAGNAHGRSQIYVMGPDGSGVHQVTNDRLEASQPALSPNGEMLAYKGFGKGSVRNVFV